MKKIKFSEIKFKCINLEERTDRKNWVMEHLPKYNISFEFVEGQKEPNTLYPFQFPSSYKQGNKGCFLSHYKTLKEYVGEDILGILEDDVIFCEDLKDRMEYVENNFDLDWDIFYLSSFYHLNNDPKRWNESGDFEFTNIKYIHRTFGSFCTHAYLVNPRSIPKIIKLMEDNLHRSYAIDHLYILIQPYLNCYSFTPGMANQIVGVSNIDNTEKNQTVFQKILGDHYFQNKLSDFDYEKYFGTGISKNIKEYIFKNSTHTYKIFNHDYFSTEYRINSDTELKEIQDYTETLEWLQKISKGRKVIDVGGNCGLFCIPSSLLGYETYSFEPVKMNVDLLEKGKKINNCNNLKIIHSALSNENKQDVIYVPYCSDNSSMNKNVAISNLKKKDFFQEQINCVRFDDWLKDNPIDDIGFIKIDVQGYEKSVLDGMSNFLDTNNRICLFIEWDKKHTEMAGFRLEEMSQFLNSKGFKEMKSLYNDKIFYKE